MSIYTINQKFQAMSHLDPLSSDRAKQVAKMFDVDLGESHEAVLYENLVLDVRPGDVVFVTGPSGSGKSALIERLCEAIGDTQRERAHLVSLDEIDIGEMMPVIDLMRGPLESALRLLSAAGLADAFLLMRHSPELSDGQRYRLRLALALDAVLVLPGSKPILRVLVVDDFCSTLDRLCAKAVAYRIRRLADTHGLTVILASAHDDLVEDLTPDVLVVKHAGGRVEVHYTDLERREP